MSDTTPPSRPSKPVLGPKPERPAARSVRPGAATAAAARPVIAPTRVVVVAAPPEPAGPSPWAAAAVRQTLVPPCLVLGIAAAGLGTAYFCQPADAALREIAPIIPIALLCVGGVMLAVTAVLMASLRPPAASGRAN